MKKLKVIMIILLMEVLVIACGSNIVEAVGAQDSNPDKELGTGNPPPYAAGPQGQEQGNEEGKEEEKKNGAYKKGTKLQAKKDGVVVNAGYFDENIIKTLKKGEEVVVQDYDKKSDKYKVSYDNGKRTGYVKAKDLSKGEQSKEEAYSDFEKEVNHFIEAQKERDYEYIEDQLLMNTYNTAKHDYDRINDAGMKNDLRKIMNEINNVLTSRGWNVSQNNGKINWTKGDESVSTDPSKGDNNENESIRNPANQQEKEEEEEPDSPIYLYPGRETAAEGETVSEQSLEDMISDADKFINAGNSEISQTSLSNFSKTMYNILLSVGIVVAVIVGALIGIKLMTSSIEEKAEAKKLLVPYVVGCVIVFGGFAIWKLVVTILESI